MFDRIKRKFYSTLKRGLKDERGAAGILFTAALTIIVMIGIGGITAAQRIVVRAELERIAEKASMIALTEYMKENDIKAADKAARDYIYGSLIKPVAGVDARYHRAPRINKLSISVVENAGTMPKAMVEIYHGPLGDEVSGIKYSKELVVERTATIADKNTEIVVVMDISGSMREQGRMRRAKKALTDFSGFLFGPAFKSKLKETAISLVPYAGSVHWGEQYASFAKPSSANPDDWRGCLVYWERFADGWTDDLVAPGSLERMGPIKTNREDPWCPAKNNKVLEFAETADQFTKAVNAMTFGDGTSTDTGMAWGFRLLSPKWKGQFKSTNANKFPLELEAGTKQKHLILLTDGKISLFHAHYGRRQGARNFRKTCQNIGAAGITMHIIGYDITDPYVNEQLQECASYGGSQFYEADTQSNPIQAVFNNIKSNVFPVMMTADDGSSNPMPPQQQPEAEGPR